MLVHKYSENKTGIHKVILLVLYYWATSRIDKSKHKEQNAVWTALVLKKRTTFTLLFSIPRACSSLPRWPVENSGSGCLVGADTHLSISLGFEVYHYWLCVVMYLQFFGDISCLQQWVVVAHPFCTLPSHFLKWKWINLNFCLILHMIVVALEDVQKLHILLFD